MKQHVFMTYDDSTPETTRQADQTHAQLLDMGYKVLTSEAGYTTTRIEYARI